MNEFLKDRISIRRSHIFKASEWHNQIDWLRVDVAQVVRAVADRLDTGPLLRIDRRLLDSVKGETP
jgi:hypothetical protein